MLSRFLWSKICYSLLTGEKLLTKVFIKIRSLIFIRLCFNMMPLKRFFLAPQNVSGPAQRQTDLRFLCLVKTSDKIEVSNSFFCIEWYLTISCEKAESYCIGWLSRYSIHHQSNQLMSEKRAAWELQVGVELDRSPVFFVTDASLSSPYRPESSLQ